MMAGLGLGLAISTSYNKSVRWNTHSLGERQRGALFLISYPCIGMNAMYDGLRVMFVEDDPAVRAATAQTLDLAGFEIEQHASAKSALKNLKEYFPGVLLVDFQLTGMNGIALLERAMTIDRSLDGDVERRGRLVGDQERRARWRWPWRSSPADASRPRTRAGTGRTGARVRHAHESRRWIPRSRAALRSRSWCA